LEDLGDLNSILCLLGGDEVESMAHIGSCELARATGGFFGRLGQYWERIWDIVEVLTPVETLICFTEVPERSWEMMLLRLASERERMM